MSTNIGSHRVLVIRMENGEIESVSDENRSVYENTKGLFIKTVSDGQIYLDEESRAIISYRHKRVERANGNPFFVRRKSVEPVQEVENALHKMFSDFNLGGFIK